MLSKYFPHALLGLFIPYFVFFAIEPYSRSVWWAENIPIIVIVLLLVLSFKKFRFSNLAYFFMAFWIFWHTYGGHFTFELAPFGVVNDFFGWERNMFDRFGHFMIGFFAYPIAEFMAQKKFITHKTSLFLFALFSIMSLAATYELIEWWYAVTCGGEAGAAFLGSQGDIWDAQKDILCDTLGAIFVLVIFGFTMKKRG